MQIIITHTYLLGKNLSGILETKKKNPNPYQKNSNVIPYKQQLFEN